MVQVIQIRGRRGVEVIWTKSKRTATFFRETFLKEDWNLHIIKLTYKTSWKGRQALNSGSFCPFRIDFVGSCVIRFTFLCKIAHFTYFQTQEERRPIPTGWLLGGWVPKIRFWAHDTVADHCVQLLTSQLAQDWSPFCEHVRTQDPVFSGDVMGGFGLFLLLLFIAFVLYMIIGVALQVMKGASGLEVVLSEK